MKRPNIFSLVLLAMCFGTMSITSAFQAEDGGTSSTEKKVRFTFQEQDWEDVIPWFADQAGYSLQPISDWPDSTFNLTDDSEYTVLEALDQLNHSLRMNRPAVHTDPKSQNADFGQSLRYELPG